MRTKVWQDEQGLAPCELFASCPLSAFAARRLFCAFGHHEGSAMSFAILTDTSCNLPAELVEQYDLSMVPLRYYLDGREYTSFTDGVQADFSDFYAQLRAGKVVTTSLADPTEATEVAERLVSEGRDVLYIGFSSGLSGTYGAVSAALDGVAERHPERRVLSVDSLAASAGQGLLITYVAQLRDAGMSIDACHDWALYHRLNVCHWFTVDDLMFLKRGGRVSAVSAIFGTALSIKPVMHVDTEGKLSVVDKVRGRKKSLTALVDRLEASSSNDIEGARHIYISHGDCYDDAKMLADMIMDRCSTADNPLPYPLITYVDPVIGAHSGPGTLALFFYDDDTSHR